MNYQTTIGDDLDVEVEYEIIGKYYPATMTDPEEYPDMHITSVICNECQIVDCLNDETLDTIVKQIEDGLYNEFN